MHLNLKLMAIISLAAISLTIHAGSSLPVRIPLTLGEKTLFLFPYKSGITGYVEPVTQNYFIIRNVRGYTSDYSGIIAQQLVMQDFNKNSLCRRFIRSLGFKSRGFKHVKDSLVTISSRGANYYHSIEKMECVRNTK